MSVNVLGVRHFGILDTPLAHPIYSQQEMHNGSQLGRKFTFTFSAARHEMNCARQLCVARGSSDVGRGIPGMCVS